jgi:L-ascorbate metabolism protein UlaG (beta-lactamase superfamily)
MVTVMGLCNLVLAFFLFIAVSISAGEKNIEGRSFNVDTIKTSAGNLETSLIGHASLMFVFNGKVIHIDPVMTEADYNKMPKADIIMVTHEHGDHLDPVAISAVRTKETAVVLTQRCSEKVKGGIVMKNGDGDTVKDLAIESVPAYNIVSKRANGEPFHPKGIGNGYVITFGDRRIYVAGDTENTPEMKALKNIYVAILPMNLPYTMSAKMVADAVTAFKPAILYLYHRDDNLVPELKKLLEKEEIDIRIS